MACSISQFNIHKNVSLGKAKSPVAFCGPCVIESRDHIMHHANLIAEIADKVGISLVFKSSYDKANRTSASSYRGVGLDKGLAILEEVRREFDVPVMTDIHSVEEAEIAGAVVDVIQIPAFLCRQTDILIAAAKTSKTVLIKKGQFLAPQDMQYAVEKVVEAGNNRVAVCERGTCFGYRELIVDFRGLEIMHNISCPVVFDATHSVQVMGGAGGKSSGNREYVAALARAACAVGVDGIFVECHETPDSAPSDGPNMLPLSMLKDFLLDVKTLSEIPLKTRDNVGS